MGAGQSAESGNVKTLLAKDRHDKELVEEIRRVASELYRKNKSLFLNDSFCRKLGIESVDTLSEQLSYLELKQVYNELNKGENQKVKKLIAYSEPSPKDKYIVNQLKGQLNDMFFGANVPQTYTVGDQQVSLPQMRYIAQETIGILDGRQHNSRKQVGGQNEEVDNNVDDEEETDDENNNNNEGKETEPNLSNLERMIGELEGNNNKKPNNKKPNDKKPNNANNIFAKLNEDIGNLKVPNNKPEQKEPVKNNQRKEQVPRKNNQRKEQEPRRNNRSEQKEPMRNNQRKEQEPRRNNQRKEQEPRRNNQRKEQEPRKNNQRKEQEPRKNNRSEQKEPRRNNRFDLGKVATYQFPNCRPDSEDCVLTKEELCYAIAKHFIVRNNIIAAIVSALPNRDNFVGSRIHSLENGVYCLPPPSDINSKNSLSLDGKLKEIAKFLPERITKESCDAMKGTFVKQSESDHQAMLTPDNEYNQQFIKYAGKMEKDYEKSLNELKAILRILENEMKINTEELMKLAEKTKLILNDMYASAQLNYLLAVLMVIDKKREPANANVKRGRLEKVKSI